MLTLNAPLAVRAVAVGVGGGGIQALRPLRCGRLPLVLVVVVVLVVLVVVVLTNGRRRRRHVYRCKHPPPAMFTDVTPRPHRVYRCKPLPRHYVAPHYPITPPALSPHAPRPRCGVAVVYICNNRVTDVQQKAVTIVTALEEV